MVAKCLTEKAAKWYELDRDMALLWAKFKAFLNQQFPEISTLNKPHVKL